MVSNSFTSSFKVPRTVTCIVLCVGTFVLLNLALVKVAPYTDSNYVLMEGVNDQSWEEGGDVLFLGDSRGHQGLIPSVFEERMAEYGVELQAMNLSRPGMQTPFAYYFSKRVLGSSSKPPKVVVVNFSFYLLGGQDWMKDIYFAYYRPSLKETYHATVMKLLPWHESAEWYVRTRVPAWMFRKRANRVVRALLNEPRALRSELAGIYSQQDLSGFDISKGYYSRGFEHISESDVIMPHGYTTGFERGYDVYFEYLNLMLQELAARNIQVYIYRFPWPEQRATEESLEKVLDHYWDKLKEGNDQIATVHFLDNVYYWPVDQFADPLHLNHPGAMKLTTTLVDKIIQHPSNSVALKPFRSKVARTASLVQEQAAVTK